MVRKLKQIELERIRNNVRTHGIASVPAVMTASTLAKLQDLVRETIAHAGHCEFSMRDGFAGTIIDELARSPQMRLLLKRVFTALFGAEPTLLEPFHVLRVIAMQRSQRLSHQYHFDAYRLTVLVPIFIPDVESRQNGDLIIFPRFRKSPRNATWNALQKAALQNPIAWKFFSARWIRRRLGGTSLKLVPGSIYVFEGLTTYHANDRCDPRALRATLLFHLEDPFTNSPLLVFFKRWRTIRDGRARKRRQASGGRATSARQDFT